MALFRRWRARSDDGGLPGGRGIPPAPTNEVEVEVERPELVELEVGYDRFAAGALVARLEAEDIPVRLLTMDDHGLSPGVHRRHPHRLLLRAADQDRVREIIHRTS